MMELYITRAEDLFDKYAQTGGAWQGTKNWFGNLFQGQTGQPSSQNPQQIAQQLQQAWVGFARLHNQQVQQLNPAMKSIKQVIDGMVSQTGAQAMQMQPGMQNQIMQLVQSLQQAVAEENQDAQLIADVAQRADGIA